MCTSMFVCTYISYHVTVFCVFAYSMMNIPHLSLHFFHKLLAQILLC